MVVSVVSQALRFQEPFASKLAFRSASDVAASSLTHSTAFSGNLCMVFAGFGYRKQSVVVL